MRREEKLEHNKRNHIIVPNLICKCVKSVERGVEKLHAKLCMAKVIKSEGIEKFTKIKRISMS